MTERAFADHRRSRDMARVQQIRARIEASGAAAPPASPAVDYLIAVNRRHARDEHDRILNARSGACAALAAFLW